MKVVGIVIIILGLIMVYVGITGDQHNLMEVITGKTTAVASGQPINLTPGVATSSSTTAGNDSSNPSSSGDVAV